MDTQTQKEIEKVNYLASEAMPMPMQVITILLNLVAIVLGWFSLTWKVFIRKDFGARYLSILGVLLTEMTFQTFRFFYWLTVHLFNFRLGSPMSWISGLPDFSVIFSGGISTVLYVLFIYGFLTACAIHLIAIRRRESEGKEWHSMSFGVSLLEYLPWDLWHWLVNKVFDYVGNLWFALLDMIPIPAVRNALEELTDRVPFFLVRELLIVNDWKLYRFIEPFLCYMAAQAIKPIDGMLGTWLMIASFALFVENNMTYFELRGRALDIMDARIESHYLNAALNREDMRKTAGFRVIPVPMSFVSKDFTNKDMDIAATVQETMGPPETATNTVVQ